MTFLYLDFETWSPVNLARRGVDVYAREARPLILTYALDDGPIEVWDLTVEPAFRKSFRSLLARPDIILVAHNAFFDRTILKHAWGIADPVTQWWCTQAQAQAHGLPGSLAQLCKVMGLPAEQTKIMGTRLIRQFCGPRKPYPSVHKGDDQADWDLFLDYAARDVESMRECHRRMPTWNYRDEELRVWHQDQVINSRGFHIDRDFAEHAVAALSQTRVALNKRTAELTAGEVQAATQRDKVLKWLCERQGCILPDLRAATIEAALQDDETLEESTREVLRLRLESSKTSTSKFQRLLDSVGPDGRLRGTLNFAGASRTARWAGRVFQPHNLPRPDMPSSDIKRCIQLIKTDRLDLIPLFAENLPSACSNALRGLIVAEPHRKLLVGDWSNIEGRVLAWLAGERWKLKAFAKGEDLYKIIFSKSFGTPLADVTKYQRQQGKGMELSMGYGGGVGAFVNVSGAYGLDLEELARTVPQGASEEVKENAQRMWDWAIDKKLTLGLREDVFVACEILKRLYRDVNPAITAYWSALESAARVAVTKPGEKITVGDCIFDGNAKWLRIRLPSGRYLCYPVPKMGHSTRSRVTVVTYMAYRNRRWRRTSTYGGKIAENITQAVARDILAAAILRVAAADMPIILHVHDEILAEVSEERRLDELLSLMTVNPKWAKGLPLAAEGFEATRYEK